MKYILIAVAFGSLVSCGSYPTDEFTWVDNNINKCRAMLGKPFYDAIERNFECYKVPQAPISELLYAKKYEGSENGKR